MNASSNASAIFFTVIHLLEGLDGRRNIACVPGG